MARLALLTVAVVCLVATACAFSDPSETKPSKDNLAKDAKLRVGVLKRVTDCKAKTKNGDRLSMHYTGWTRSDGQVFDSSVSRGDPFEFNLGKGMVIKGWDQGLVGMCIGERRRLTIPSDMGYGDHGSGAKIPGGATLVFDVELLKINGKTHDEL
eukprot:m.481714 g.481714  ORF g.481714 m.481714 type:complete len:155 (-) comp22288_c0_seq1:57-521(-)